MLLGIASIIPSLLDHEHESYDANLPHHEPLIQTRLHIEMENF
jgi:hypothetical protein